jgi:hypothetical protein
MGVPGPTRVRSRFSDSVTGRIFEERLEKVESVVNLAILSHRGTEITERKAPGLSLCDLCASVAIRLSQIKIT